MHKDSRIIEIEKNEVALAVELSIFLRVKYVYVQLCINQAAETSKYNV